MWLCNVLPEIVNNPFLPSNLSQLFLTKAIEIMGSAVVQTQEITADNVRELFSGVDTHLASSHRVFTNDSDLQGYDEEQIRLMGEVCIILNRDDLPIGSSSKKYCMMQKLIPERTRCLTRS